jgi:hypothetical protein
MKGNLTSLSGLLITGGTNESRMSVYLILKKWFEQSGIQVLPIDGDSDDPLETDELKKYKVTEGTLLILNWEFHAPSDSDKLRLWAKEKGFDSFLMLEVLCYPEDEKSPWVMIRPQIVKDWILDKSYKNITYSTDDVQLKNTLCELFTQT